MSNPSPARTVAVRNLDVASKPIDSVAGCPRPLDPATASLADPGPLGHQPGRPLRLITSRRLVPRRLQHLGGELGANGLLAAPARSGGPRPGGGSGTGPDRRRTVSAVELSVLPIDQKGVGRIRQVRRYR